MTHRVRGLVGNPGPPSEADRAMRALKPARILVLTMLDVEQEANQRVQHLVEMLGHEAAEVVVVSKVKAMDRSPWGVVRDALRTSLRARTDGKVTVLALHPPLNYAQALAAGMVQGSVQEEPGWLRRALAAALSTLGIARDLVIAPSFCAAVLWRARGRFDLCIAEGPFTGLVARVLRELGRVRRMVYEDIDHVAGGQFLGLRRAYVGWLERSSVRAADRVISAGWMLGALRECTTGRRVRVIPNGVDPERFRVMQGRRPHPPTLFYVGHLAHYCGVDLAIQALPRLRERVPDVRLVIAGGGDRPYVDGLAERARRAGLEDRVQLLGEVPYEAVPRLCAEADLGLCTFRNTPLGAHAFPLKVLEYMASGLPVLCSAGSEAAEILRRHPAGRAVSFDPEAFADAAAALLLDPEAHAKARAAGIAGAQELSWKRALGDFRQALLEVLEQEESAAQEVAESLRTLPSARG